MQIASESALIADNPHLWLASYGIRAHYFVWAVAHGALDDIEAGGQRGEDAVQLALLPGSEPVRSTATRKAAVAYRSRGPVRSDVLIEDRAARQARRMLGIRLRRENVLRG